MTRASSPYRHLLGLAPDEACHATYCYQRPGGLLHRRFTLTPSRTGRSVLCCAISQVTRADVIRHRALWSPEVPQPIPEDHGRGHQEVSSLQLYIRCGKGGIPPCGEAMPLPVILFSPWLGIVGRFVNDAPNIGWGVSGVLWRVVWRRIKSVRAWYVREEQENAAYPCSIYHDEQTSQPDKPVSNLLIGDCCQSPSIYIVSLQRKARE